MNSANQFISNAKETYSPVKTEKDCLKKSVKWCLRLPRMKIFFAINTKDKMLLVSEFFKIFGHCKNHKNHTLN